MKSFLIFGMFFLGAFAVDVPEQIHISFGDRSDVIVVMWSCKSHVTCHVVFGSSASHMINHSNSEISTLNLDNWNALKILHRAELWGLSPGRRYFYQVHCSQDGERTNSSVFSFKTPGGETKREAKFLLYGDLGAVGGIPTFPALLDDITRTSYDAIWHIGDFGYNLHSNGGKVGDDFMRQLQDIAARIPYMTAPGNHELEKDMHHYRVRFSMPHADWPMRYDRLWYSVDAGPVHFISYSTEVFFVDNQDYVCKQYNWLLEDLKKANQNRHNRPWIIAMGHRPMYCSNKNIDDCTGRVLGYWVKYGLEDLFYAQGVDFVLQAHEHSYERLWPVYDYQVTSKSYEDPEAPVHVISGAAGCGENVDYMGEPKPWSAFRADTRSSHSYGRLIVVNETHLLFEQVSVNLNTTIDKFWLTQHHHGPRIKNWECNEGYSNHHTCNCPLPFHYVTVAIFAGVFLIIIIAMSVYFCTKCCHCCQIKSCAGSSKCCRGSNKCCYHTKGFPLFRQDKLKSNDSTGRLMLLSEEEDEDFII
ncbi:acid phosphatase type 7-like [Saccostrea cucullata]|uniref:acid phosphatase type 7-like n=1 Tax=Saccostrea cuccullata TaxID=36930 RepID=UPI002ED29391